METDAKKTILVVDDESPLLNLIAIYLAKAGYNVITADSGLEAISQFRLNEYRISLILSDVDCEGGFPINGPAFIKQIMSECSGIPPVIFMTGYPTPERIAALSKLNRSLTLPKPFDRETLLRTISIVLERTPVTNRSATAA